MKKLKGDEGELYTECSMLSAEKLLQLIKNNRIKDNREGCYAFVYAEYAEGTKKENKIIKITAGRDILGIKPLFYCLEPLFFSSNKKEMIKNGITDIKELEPRTILHYDCAAKKAIFEKRDFFSCLPEHKKAAEEMEDDVKQLVIDAVRKTIPGTEKFGILFSGGIDSSLIAYVCRHILKRDFICYTAAFDDKSPATNKSPQMKDAEDLIYAKKTAEALGLKLKTKKLNLDEAENIIKKIVPIIEDDSVMKVGVAMPFFAACEMAKQDSVKIILSGLGSEEIFAGYERHKKSSSINDECVKGLLSMHERDLFRDYAVADYYGLELRVPLLDNKLVEYALKIPPQFKIDKTKAQNKIIIRKIAEKLGVPKETAWRRKQAAQYGSRFDKAIEKLAKKSGCGKKAEYISKFNTFPRLAALCSSGKDSIFAMYKMKKLGFPIACIVSMHSKNPSSYMFHTPNAELVKMQADAMGIPLIEQETAGEKELELADLTEALKKAAEKFRIKGVVTGALCSEYQKKRIADVCRRLDLAVYSPLWHIGQEEEMREILNTGFEVVLSSIAADGLDKTWLGRRLVMADADRLAELSRKNSINIAGEGGEFESLVLDCPLFRKKIRVVESDIVMENENTGIFRVKKAEFSDKI